jgi:hypothetical protein
VLVASLRPALAQLRVLGTTASVVVAIGGWLAGPVPDSLAGASLLPFEVGTFDPAIVCVYAGLVLLVVAWWRLGRVLHSAEGTSVTRAQLYGLLAAWAAPLLVCPPLFSRDVYSYLAQGAMTVAGIDIYAHGPATLGGPLAAEVPSIWQHSPAPYGPVFVLYAITVTHISGTNIVVGVLGMRLFALAGIALLLWALPRLAERCGASPNTALWLGVLNPLVLAHGVAGAHNDMVMLGLLLAGLAVATDNARTTVPPWLRLVSGAVLITLATLVKAPAALGLLFLIPIWVGRRTGWWACLRSALTISVVAAATAVCVSTLAGTGYGWTRVLGTPVSADNWSPTSAIGRFTGTLLELAGAGSEVATGAVPFWRWAGLVLTVGFCCFVWLRHEQLGPVHALGLAMTAAVVLGPAFRPWYLLWGVVPLAATLLPGKHDRLRLYAAASCAVLVMVVLPDGTAPDLPLIG